MPTELRAEVEVIDLSLLSETDSDDHQLPVAPRRPSRKSAPLPSAKKNLARNPPPFLPLPDQQDVTTADQRRVSTKRAAPVIPRRDPERPRWSTIQDPDTSDEDSEPVDHPPPKKLDQNRASSISNGDGTRPANETTNGSSCVQTAPVSAIKSSSSSSSFSRSVPAQVSTKLKPAPLQTSTTSASASENIKTFPIQSAADTTNMGTKNGPISLPVSPFAATFSDVALASRESRRSVKRQASPSPSSATQDGGATKKAKSSSHGEEPFVRMFLKEVCIPISPPPAEKPSVSSPPIRRAPAMENRCRADPLPLWKGSPSARQRQQLWRESHGLLDKSTKLRVNDLVRAEESDEEDSCVVRDQKLETRQLSPRKPEAKSQALVPIIQHPNEPKLPATLGFGKFRNPILEALQQSSASTALDRTILGAYFSGSLRVPGELQIASGRARTRANMLPQPEFVYSDDMYYSASVDPPMESSGCSCVGPCQDSEDCSCSKIQEMYFKHLCGEYGEDFKHKFACDEDGLVIDAQFPIFECSASCGCPPSCRNRTIQNARLPEVEIFKTATRGWGVRAKKLIHPGTFIGFYSGEVIREEAVDARAHVYDQVGRTYLFDLEGYHFSRPPPGLEKVNPDFARIAYDVAKEANKGGDPDGWSAYSIDAFAWGNITRFVNHSCDPNTLLSTVYFDDYDLRKPRLALISRKWIHPGTEVTISYTSHPDDDDKVVEDVQLIDAAARDSNDDDDTFFIGGIPKANKGKGKSKAKGRRKAKKITSRSKSTGKTTTKNAMACLCGADNCTGRMFAVGSTTAKETSDD